LRIADVVYLHVCD